MTKEELINKYNNNQSQINKLSVEMQHVSIPIHEYHRKKDKAEDIEQSITHITSRITGTGFLLAIVPILPVSLAGLTLLTIVASCKGIVLYKNIKLKKLKNLSSEQTIIYNNLFQQQYKLISEQEKLKQEIEQLDKQAAINSKQEINTRLLPHLTKIKNQKSKIKNSTNRNIDNVIYTIDTSSQLTENDIYKSVEI